MLRNWSNQQTYETRRTNDQKTKQARHKDFAYIHTLPTIFTMYQMTKRNTVTSVAYKVAFRKFFLDKHVKNLMYTLIKFGEIVVSTR